MARSQEALAKRAEKRSVPLAEQRLNDARKKTKTSNSGENSDEKKAVVVKKPVVKAPVIPIKDTNDWICTKCTNKNFHHRDTCNRCQETRASQAVKAPEKAVIAEKTVTATSSKERNVEVAKSPVGAVLSNGNWCCTACNNENFPSRTECNRCQLDRPSTGSSSSGKDKKIKIVPKAPPADRIAKGKGPISGKSLSWGKQASDSEIAENNRLREVHTCRVSVTYYIFLVALSTATLDLFLARFLLLFVLRNPCRT